MKVAKSYDEVPHEKSSFSSLASGQDWPQRIPITEAEWYQPIPMSPNCMPPSQNNYTVIRQSAKVVWPVEEAVATLIARFSKRAIADIYIKYTHLFRCQYYSKNTIKNAKSQSLDTCSTMLTLFCKMLGKHVLHLDSLPYNSHCIMFTTDADVDSVNILYAILLLTSCHWKCGIICHQSYVFEGCGLTWKSCCRSATLTWADLEKIPWAKVTWALSTLYRSWAVPKWLNSDAPDHCGWASLTLLVLAVKLFQAHPSKIRWYPISLILVLFSTGMTRLDLENHKLLPISQKSSEGHAWPANTVLDQHGTYAQNAIVLNHMQGSAGLLAVERPNLMRRLLTTLLSCVTSFYTFWSSSKWWSSTYA